MNWISWVISVNLIDGFNYYLILAFVIGTVVRIRMYRSVVGMVSSSPTRWPKLVQLARSSGSIFLGWPMLLAVGLAFGLMLANSLAIHLVWASAKVTLLQLWPTWIPLLTVTVSGTAMLLLDGWTIFGFQHFDRAALEVDLDRAESWLKSWMAPAVRLVTFGFINPRKMVGAEVHQALVDLNWIIIGGMRRTSLRIAAQLVFGLTLWLTWAFAPGTSP